jgi:hypothetical protein
MGSFPATSGGTWASFGPCTNALPSQHLVALLRTVLCRYAVYAIMVVLGSAIIIKDTGSSSSKLFKRGARTTAARLTPEDTKEHPTEPYAPTDKAEPEKRLANDAPVFTFKNVRYTVQVDGKDKVLLVSQSMGTF